ncbi:MAG: hypothetical protein Q7U97_09295, partial [Rhodocyclaceae bacterium]|nr:hypothetical protein [Rhodocyclaceae bacterium]
MLPTAQKEKPLARASGFLESCATFFSLPAPADKINLRFYTRDGTLKHAAVRVTGALLSPTGAS